MNNGPSVWGHPTGLCLARKGRGYPRGRDVGAQRLLEGGQGSPHPGKRSSQPQFPHLQLCPEDPLVYAEEVCACLGTVASSPNHTSLKLLLILQVLVPPLGPGGLPRLRGNFPIPAAVLL